MASEGSGGDDDQGSSSSPFTNHQPPQPSRPIQARPRRYFGPNVGGSTPQVRAYWASASPPPQIIRPVAAVPPFIRRPPSMGIPGMSAFSRFHRQNSRHSWPARGGSTAVIGNFPAGIQGISAFGPYTRPPPRPHTPSGTGGAGTGLIGFGSGFGLGFLGIQIRPRPPPPRPNLPPSATVNYSRPSGRGSGLLGAQAVPVGGSGSAGVGRQEILRIGRSPMVKKRGREGGASGSAAPAENQPGEGTPDPITCSICERVFHSAKALFGHMRSHPNRGWKGARPPPAFRAAEEFADVKGLNQSAMQTAAGPEEVVVQQTAEAPLEAEEGQGETEEQTGETSAVEADGKAAYYSVPDLNGSPPSEN